MTTTTIKNVWDWTAFHLPERVLRTFDAVPFVVVTRKTRARAERNAFELGRDYQRSEHRKELSTVATMLSAIQESVTTRQS